jgi:2-haloacid dehalogenase
MRVERVAFDLYGTLLDVSGLAQRLRAFAGEEAPGLLARWRKAQLDRTWELNRLGRYQPFDEVTARALEQVAPGIPAGVREQMCATWLSLPAFSDAREALAKLAAAGIRRLVLSNGTLSMIRAALDASGLPIDEIRSADEVRAYKTDPRVYALLPLAGTLFVSGNGWDAEGAKRAGLNVAWLDRGGPAPGLAPDLRAGSLSELAAELT